MACIKVVYMSRRNNDDLYNVSTYTDKEIYDILELTNPTDRELEAKILIMVNKYTRMGGGNQAADQLQQFFIDIYTRFFDVSDDEGGTTTEGFEMRTPYADANPSIPPLPQPQNPPPPTPERNTANTQNRYLADPRTAGYTQTPIMTNTFDIGTATNVGNGRTFSNFVGNTNIADVRGNVIAGYQTPQITQTYDVSQITNRGVLDTTQNQRDQGGISLTKPVDYSKDTLNPLLKQTIKRVISIDSQYRENKQAISTEFTFNLSEPLRDVVSLKLYSIQIPFTWYTINSSFGGNFFYIKGDVEGINNGDHDYRVEINSGNYTALELITAISRSIRGTYNSSGVVTKPGLIQNYPDVDFGNTDITYDTNTVKSTLTINLKEAFGESNYYVDFVNWSSPISNDDPLLVAQRSTTLAGYLGYNHTTYGIYCAYSMRVLPQTDATTYTIGSGNNTISLVLYTVSDTSTQDYTTSTKTVIETITLTLPQRNYTRSELILAINTQITANTTAFDMRYSGLSLVNITSANQSGYGYAYVRFDFKLTRRTARNIESLKCALVLPDDAVWVLKSPSNSCFFFANSVNELSNVLSESPPLKSKYVIGPSANYFNRIRLRCLTDEYDGGNHDYLISLLDSPAEGYTLSEYIAAINSRILSVNAATTVPNSNQLTTTEQTRMVITNDYFARLYVSIRREFTTPQYTVKFYGNNSNADLTRLFNVVEGSEYDLEESNLFEGEILTITFQRGYDRIEIIPKGDVFGSPVPPNFIVYMIDPVNGPANYTISNVNVFETYLNQRIQTYTDNQGKTPLANSLVSLSPFQLTINVSKILTYADYQVEFESNQSTGMNATNHSWTDYLGFDLSYDLTTPNHANYVQGTLKKTANTIELMDGSNNYFYIRTSRDINGLNDAKTAGVYDIRVNLTPGTYTTDTLYTEINRRFNNNPLTLGSKISQTATGITQMRLNVNKVFRAKDYRLVFYDQFSFVSCYSGASRNGNKSIQNSTWDTTVGWIIGFRQNIIYNLKDYEGYASLADNNVYFENERTCVMVGDTTVSTSLYNYFLIVLDDYTQNHLNDGLVTITTQETSIAPEDYTYVCDPYATSGSTLIAVPSSRAHDGTYQQMTRSQLYSFNQKVLSKKVKEKSYSKGPFVKDIFGIIPIKTSGLQNGATYVEFGGTLQNQERMYFGPVNIHRMTIRLLNDRGDLVDLNNSNWSFSLVCEQLYRSNT